MLDRSQDSVHPYGRASSVTSVSDREDPVRWAALYEQLIAADTVAYALRPTAGDLPPEKVATGPALELISESEHLGEGRAELAIVAPVRPDLLVIDLDRCADLMLDPVLRAADDYAAQVAHLAASGSDDSMHVALACPSAASREAIITAIHTVRSRHALSPTACDIRTATQFLRLPGSASLKPGGDWCHPIDVDTREPITPAAAAHRAHRAVLCLPASGLAGLSAAARSISRSTTPTAPERAPDEEWGALDHEAPRAWRRRAPLTADQWRVLRTSPGAGERSHSATAAAWVLWQYGVRSWKVAATWYRTYPVFAKFAVRRDKGAAHWRSIVKRARAHRPPPDPHDADLIADVIAEIACWDDHELIAAAHAVITHRFADGYGTTDRPIAWRDLAIWLTVSPDTAGRRLQALQQRGLLRLTTPHDRATAPGAAHCWTLCRPDPLYRTDLRHDITEGGKSRTLLHPLWSSTGHTAHLIWSLLSPTTSTPTALLVPRSGLRSGTLSHGLRRVLDVLERLGLATREGTGRSTRWRRGSQTLDAAADAAGVTQARLELLRTLNAERAAWHAPTVRSSLQVRHRLRELVGRSHHRGQPSSAAAGLPMRPSLQLTLPLVHQQRRAHTSVGNVHTITTRSDAPQPP